MVTPGFLSLGTSMPDVKRAVLVAVLVSTAVFGHQTNGGVRSLRHEKNAFRDMHNLTFAHTKLFLDDQRE